MVERKNIGFHADQRFRQSYEEHYDRKGRDQRQWRLLGAVEKARNIMVFCRDIPHERILEIGCGDEAILERLDEEAFADELYAIEVSPSARTLTTERKLPHLVECRLYDGLHVPHSDDTFDLVILSHVVEHLEHPRQMIYEAARVGRHVFIEVPLEDTLRMAADFTWNSTGHINTYSYKTIRRLVQTCNLRILRQSILLPSKQAHTYYDGTCGALKYWIKRSALAFAPQWAARRFVYHCALLCGRNR